MSDERAAPTAEWLAESKRRNNVPATWQWAWCSNSKCGQVVWYNPESRESARRAGVAFMPVCGAKCALTTIRLMP